MRKLTALFAASALSLAVLVGRRRRRQLRRTPSCTTTITHKKTQYFHIVSGQRRARRRPSAGWTSKAWYTCGLGGETLRNLKKGIPHLPCEGDYKGKADPTPAAKTWKVN